MKFEQREQAIEASLGRKVCPFMAAPHGGAAESITTSEDCVRCGNAVMSGLGGGSGFCATCIAVRGDDYYFGTHLTD